MSSVIQRCNRGPEVASWRYVADQRTSLRPIAGANRALRQRLTLRDELILALLPTVLVLGVFALVQVFSNQRLLFASLASSAFLIYLDPQHGTNSVRTLVASQLIAASLGLATFTLIGSGYLSGGVAMILTIVLMIVFDVVHPPAVSTALSFAFRTESISNVLLFGLALTLITLLVVMQRVAVYLLARIEARR